MTPSPGCHFEFCKWCGETAEIPDDVATLAQTQALVAGCCGGPLHVVDGKVERMPESTWDALAPDARAEMIKVALMVRLVRSIRPTPEDEGGPRPN